MKFEWEEIWCSEDYPNMKVDRCWETTYRAKVYGGWLLRYQTLFDNKIQSEEEMVANGWDSVKSSIIFIPDAKHEWVIDYGDN